MRLVIARCSVDYAGRLTSHLPEAVRLIMVKADGCVAIHADGGAYKPLNWMNAPNMLTIGDDAWTVTNPKGESLTITLHEVLSDTEADFGDDPGLQKDGVEAHLQELLAASPHAIEEGLTLVRREYPTAIGPIDLLCRDRDGRVVAIEVKRRGEIDGVEQLARYIERLHLDSSLGSVRGVYVAQIVKPQARVLAESRGFRVVEVDYDELRGLRLDELRLFCEEKLGTHLPAHLLRPQGGTMRKFSIRPTLTLKGRTFNGIRGWSGKPMHPPLTDFPIVAYILAAAFDLISSIGGDDHEWAHELWHAGTFTFVAGVGVSVLAALTGLWDAWKSSEAGTQARRTINTHTTIMVTVTVLAIVDLIWRLNCYHTSFATPTGLTVLSVVIALLVSLGATFGGTLVYDYGFNVEAAGDSPVWHQSETDVLPGEQKS